MFLALFSYVFISTVLRCYTPIRPTYILHVVVVAALHSNDRDTQKAELQYKIYIMFFFLVNVFSHLWSVFHSMFGVMGLGQIHLFFIFAVHIRFSVVLCGVALV